MVSRTLLSRGNILRPNAPNFVKIDGSNDYVGVGGCRWPGVELKSGTTCIVSF